MDLEIPKEVQYLIRVLRRGTLGSAARNLCLRRARKKVYVRDSKAGLPIYKFHWQCAQCRDWHRDSTSLEVDHIEEVGPFKGDWHDYIQRMYFCGQGNLRAICGPCHLKKTGKFASARAKFKRKK